MASALVRLRRHLASGAGLVALAGALAACSGSSHTAAKRVVATPPSPRSTTRAPTITAPVTLSSGRRRAPPTTRTTTAAPTSSSVLGPAPGAGLVQNSQPAQPAASPPTTAGGVDMDSAKAVAVATAKALWTVNAAKDKTPFAAEVRATAYMTRSYGDEIKDNPPQAGPGAQWQSWAQHQVVTAVKVVASQDSGAPLSSPTVAYLQYGVTVTPHGAQGWKGPADTYVEFIELSRPSATAPWLVADINTSA